MFFLLLDLNFCLVNCARRELFSFFYTLRYFDFTAYLKDFLFYRAPVIILPEMIAVQFVSIFDRFYSPIPITGHLYAIGFSMKSFIDSNILTLF